MKIAPVIAMLIAGIPLAAAAQYDYNDDLIRAVSAHYPPLVRLLITKGAKQNTQDAHGDTPLMLAIRSDDRELTKLLLQYHPNPNLLSAANHCAATEAVLADDPESLKPVVAEADRLQIAQALGLATKLDKRRALNSFARLYGAAAADEIGHGFLRRPLDYFTSGTQVALTFSPTMDRADVCATPRSTLLLQGKICGRDGERLSVEWETLSNLDNIDKQCSPQRHFRLERKGDTVWDEKYLGACGSSPSYFSTVPASFDYRTFVIPELR